MTAPAVLAGVLLATVAGAPAALAAASEPAPFPERLQIALLPAVVQVLVGGAIIGGLTLFVQTRTAERARRRDHDRLDESLRQDLVNRMTQTASALYLVTQHYSRTVEALGESDDRADRRAVAEARRRLDQQYLDSRCAGEALEKQLQGYFVGRDPAETWHGVMDLLTVRYFQCVERISDRLLQVNSYGYEGRQHSGLDPVRLAHSGDVLAAYHRSLSSAVQGVFRAELRHMVEREARTRIKPPARAPGRRR